MSVVGVYGPPYNLVDFGTAMNKCQTIRTGQCSVRRYMPHLLEHIRSGRVDAKALITHRYPLEKASEAYHTFAQKQDGCIKPILLPTRPHPSLSSEGPRCTRRRGHEERRAGARGAASRSGWTSILRGGPGVPRMHAPEPLPHVRFPPEQQQSRTTVFMHGRPHKTFPPVFGTAVPPKGVSGLVRGAAFRYPGPPHAPLDAAAPRGSRRPRGSTARAGAEARSAGARRARRDARRDARARALIHSPLRPSRLGARLLGAPPERRPASRRAVPRQARSAWRSYRPQPTGRPVAPTRGDALREARVSISEYVEFKSPTT